MDRQRDSGDRIVSLQTMASVAGIAGPGRWLVAEYQPTALFSLKISSATSSVGKTLLTPTPYAIKMALIDAAFRGAISGDECAEILKALIPVAVRVDPGSRALVTQTFTKVRQESRDPDPLRPYSSTISYRELLYQGGVWKWAFDIAGCDHATAERIVGLLPRVAYIGKRGSFVQFKRCWREVALGPEFTQPVPSGGTWSPPPRAHIVPLDDFGPDADLQTLSSFTKTRPVRDRHRRFVQTIVPLGIVNSGPGFTEYSQN